MGALGPEVCISGRDKQLPPNEYCGLQFVILVWDTCFWHCGMQLLITAWDTYFWHQNHHIPDAIRILCTSFYANVTGHKHGNMKRAFVAISSVTRVCLFYSAWPNVDHRWMFYARAPWFVTWHLTPDISLTLVSVVWWKIHLTRKCFRSRNNTLRGQKEAGRAILIWQI